MKDMNIVAVIALVGIAANLTYTNLRSAGVIGVKKPAIEEKVVKVLGRATSTFDGFGADLGFLVDDHGRTMVVPYDQGSMASDPSYKPRFMKIIAVEGGKPFISPITVDQW